MSTDSSCSEESQEYYHPCACVNLDRHIGNRYFVTAANATKIILKEAAVNILVKMLVTNWKEICMSNC